MKTATAPIADWMQELPTLESAEDFAGAAARFERQIEAAERREAELGKALEAAMFDGGDVAAARLSLDSCRSDLADLRAALDGATVRRTEAAKNEAEQELKELIAANARDAAPLEAKWKGIKVKIQELREEFAAVDHFEVAIEKRNNALESAGHMNLKTNLRKIRRLGLGDAVGVQAEPLIAGLSRSGQQRDRFLRDMATPARELASSLRPTPSAQPFFHPDAAA